MCSLGLLESLTIRERPFLYMYIYVRAKAMWRSGLCKLGLWRMSLHDGYDPGPFPVGRAGGD